MPQLEDVSLGGPDTHIPALDGDAGTTNEAAEVEIPALADEPVDPDAAAAPVATADAAGEDAVEETVADDDPLLAQFAKRTGLNPKDPAQRKTLETIVSKEKYIQQLKAERAAPAAQEPQALTKFEQEQAKVAEDAAAAAAAANEGPKGPSIGQYNDVGVQWQSPTDAYTALAKAWQQANETGDLRGVVATEAALYERRFDAIGVPKIQALVEERLSKFLTEHFGEVMPSLQEQARAARASEAQEFAYKELEGTDAFKDIRTLNQEQEGPPLVVNGEEYRNTPLNKILAENPWILHIKRDHADPKVSDRLTYLARLKAAHSINSRGRIDAKTAKALVNAGSQQEQRRSQDQVRQSLNKGGTPSKSLDKGGAKPKSYIEELMGAGDGPISFSDL